MPRFLFLTGLSWVLLLGLSVSVAAAPESDAQETGPNETASPATLSSEEMLAQSKSVLAQANVSLTNVGRMMRDARADKDVIKTVCLDDLLSQIEVARRTAAERVESLEDAVSSGDTARVEHDFAVIGALAERTGALTAEANQCIGEEKGVIGGSSLVVKFDPAIPSSDTAALPLPPTISVPPPAASPTL